jgi:AbiV family abortive infection protein
VKMSVTPQFLLHGFAYALEQCGRLLSAANTLYKNGDYASAVALAAFAREEFGRANILLDLRKRVLAGEAITTDDIEKACNRHVIKQEAGMGGLTMRDSGLPDLLRVRRENVPGSAEWQKADAELERIVEMETKRAASDRHDLRMTALYVGPIAEDRWNRPAEISASTAHNFLVEATDEYLKRYREGYITACAMLRRLDPDLYSALDQWPDRPVLPPPERTPYPEDVAAP